MSTPEPTFQPITIRVVTGGTLKQQASLMGCSFDPKGADDDYHFYDKSGKEKSTAPGGSLKTGKDFTFVMDGLIWTIHHFHLDTTTLTASGKWRVSSTMQHIHDEKPGDIEEDPTFQAQAGSHEDYEAASSANA